MSEESTTDIKSPEAIALLQPNVANAADLLKATCQGALAYDEMRRKIMVRPLSGGGKPMPLDDADITDILIFLQKAGMKRLARDNAFHAIDTVARENSFHPLRDWLKGLVWDGVGRVDNWLEVYAGASPCPYVQLVGRLFLISAIARVMRPGCKVDYTLVLEGPQGCGKSTLCQTLGGEFFSDNMPHNLASKEVSQHIRDKWIIELGELSHLTSAKAEVLKAFLTRNEEQYRLPYGKLESLEPRQCVFIGTTNESQYLRDATGNRRFWPVKVVKVDQDALRQDREQLLAEAVALYEAKPIWWPTAEQQEALIAPEQRKRFQPDLWEDRIIQYLATSNTKRTLIGQLAVAALGANHLDRVPTSTTRRISTILQGLGWQPGKRGPKGERYWYHPSHPGFGIAPD